METEGDKATIRWVGFSWFDPKSWVYDVPMEVRITSNWKLSRIKD